VQRIPLDRGRRTGSGLQFEAGRGPVQRGLNLVAIKAEQK
jgi:hypothetical protein